MVTINFAPIVQAVVGLVATALGVLGSAVLVRLNQKFHLQITASQEATFDAALNKSLVYGATKASDAIAEHGWDNKQVHEGVVATALQQAVEQFPTALAGVGLSTNLNDPKNAEAITKALERALPAAMAEASASPATPPATAPNPETQAETPAATIHIVTTPSK
jgi:7-keto-8-aminopelargonate synthetase-like enzyme